MAKQLDYGSSELPVTVYKFQENDVVMVKMTAEDFVYNAINLLNLSKVNSLKMRIALLEELVQREKEKI